MPGPVQEDKYLLQNSGYTFIFSDFTPFYFLLSMRRNLQNEAERRGGRKPIAHTVDREP